MRHETSRSATSQMSVTGKQADLSESSKERELTQRDVRKIAWSGSGTPGGHQSARVTNGRKANDCIRTASPFRPEVAPLHRPGNRYAGPVQGVSAQRYAFSLTGLQGACAAPVGHCPPHNARPRILGKHSKLITTTCRLRRPRVPRDFSVWNVLRRLHRDRPYH